jgi:hypothetical protein
MLINEYIYIYIYKKAKIGCFILGLLRNKSKSIIFREYHSNTNVFINSEFVNPNTVAISNNNIV